MFSHERCVQQAGWTAELRTHVFRSVGVAGAQCVLEIGCGTGAILAGLAAHGLPSLHGIDLSSTALADCRRQVPQAFLTCGDAGSLPYPPNTFDVAFCHFLLLWVTDPLKALREMKRVTCRGGHVLALAEPDYSGRVDQPDELSGLGQLQTESMLRQGADVTLGSRLADLFHLAGIQIREAGAIHTRDPQEISAAEWETEWAVLESDVADLASAEQLETMRLLHRRGITRARPVLQVPTYFAWGQV